MQTAKWNSAGKKRLKGEVCNSILYNNERRWVAFIVFFSFFLDRKPVSVYGMSKIELG
jgi:hypothetical protein